MWTHFFIGYSLVSIAIMEIAMKDKIGSQDTRLGRAIFYISGLVVGPVAAGFGIWLGIMKTWKSRGK